MVKLINTKNDTWHFDYLVKSADGTETKTVSLGAFSDRGIVGKLQPEQDIRNDVYEKIKHQIGEMGVGIDARIRVMAS